MVEPIQPPMTSGPRWHDTYEYPDQIPQLPVSGGGDRPRATTVRQVALDTIQSVRAALLASRDSPLASPAGGGAGSARLAGADPPAAGSAGSASGELQPSSYPQRFWSCPGEAGFRIRGP